jgi:hypothetical protein
VLVWLPTKCVQARITQTLKFKISNSMILIRDFFKMSKMFWPIGQTRQINCGLFGEFSNIIFSKLFFIVSPYPDKEIGFRNMYIFGLGVWFGALKN